MYHQIVIKISILLQICFEREFAKTKLFSLDFSTRFKNFHFSFIKTIHRENHSPFKLFFSHGACSKAREWICRDRRWKISNWCIPRVAQSKRKRGKVKFSSWKISIIDISFLFSPPLSFLSHSFHRLLSPSFFFPLSFFSFIFVYLSHEPLVLQAENIFPLVYKGRTTEVSLILMPLVAQPSAFDAERTPMISSRLFFSFSLSLSLFSVPFVGISLEEKTTALCVEFPGEVGGL